MSILDYSAEAGAYLQGIEEGRSQAADLAVARLITAEDLIRRYQLELDERTEQLQISERRNRRLRAQLANPIVIALKWSAVTAVLVFIATWNVAT